MEPERPGTGNGDGQKKEPAAAGVGLAERARGQGVVIKEQTQALAERAKKEFETYKDPQQTQLWKSIFRVSHDRSDPRNRSLAIL